MPRWEGGRRGRGEEESRRAAAHPPPPPFPPMDDVIIGHVGDVGDAAEDDAAEDEEARGDAADDDAADDEEARGDAEEHPGNDDGGDLHKVVKVGREIYPPRT